VPSLRDFKRDQTETEVKAISSGPAKNLRISSTVSPNIANSRQESVPQNEKTMS
jgi:hypothetical protein